MKPTADVARGKWKGILQTLGADADHLTGKHGPCPFCGGKDRFRFDNQNGNGSFICSQCGAGNGFDFLERLNGWNFRVAAAEVDRVVGNVVAEPPQRRIDDARRREMLNDLWMSGAPVVAGDPVGQYLASRGLPMPENPNCIRFVLRCMAPDKIMRPAMVALVAAIDGAPATLHRTFLADSAKAAMDQPRAVMPGTIPEGSAIRLAPIAEHLGIAEGIETALAATARFGVPTWAAINSTMLAKWQPPQGCKRVTVFGDHDPKFGGQAAAYALAHRLACRFQIETDVMIPNTIGLDWAEKDAA